MTKALPQLPERVRSLPQDHRGFPVPWFVVWLKEGEEVPRGTPGADPDFRVIASGRVAQAHNRRLCWVCGQPRGANMAFVTGPMCAVNRVSSEPPSHLGCATFAATACPFLTKPRMRRNEKDLPEHQPMPGVGLRRNPGVALVWVTRSYKVIRDDKGGPLFQIGDPVAVHWYAEGRTATRAEVERSIDTGLPLLREACDLEATPRLRAEAHAALSAMTANALALLPAAEGAP